MTHLLRNSSPLILGFSLVCLPILLPLIAALWAIKHNLKALSKFTGLLLPIVAAGLLIFPYFMHGELLGSGLGPAKGGLSWQIDSNWQAGMRFLFQLGFVWLLYLSARHASYRLDQPVLPRLLCLGMLLGLAFMTLYPFFQLEALRFDSSKTFLQALVWSHHPNAYAHTILLSGTVVTLLTKDWMRSSALVLTALGVLASGSRESALAWLIIAGGFYWQQHRHNPKTRILHLLLLIMVIILTMGLGPKLGWGRVGFLLDIAPNPNTAHNLFQGTEIALGDWWDDSLGVSYTTEPVNLVSQTLTSYHIKKISDEPWARLQQVVILKPNTPYTLSSWINTATPNMPGLQGWARYTDEAGELQTISLEGVFYDTASSNPTWETHVSQNITVLQRGILEKQGSWARVYLTFSVDLPHNVPLWTGMSPHTQQGLGEGSSAYAGLQIEPSPFPTAYTPGPATHGLSLTQGRLPIWQTAWQGTLAKPLLGHGVHSFTYYQEQHTPQDARLYAPPTHPHNLFLYQAFEGGLISLLGLLLTLFLLMLPAWRTYDIGMLVLWAAVLLLSMFDVTLYSMGFLYPLAGISGWRSARPRTSLAERELLNQYAVIASLIFADLCCILATLSISHALSQQWSSFQVLRSSPLFATVLLWPALVAFHKLYPGYGIGSPEELKRHVRATTLAAVAFVVLWRLFSPTSPLNLLSLCLGFLLMTVCAPIVRYMCKSLLHRYQLWGKRTLILGAGQTGNHLLKILHDHPLLGFKPCCFFDDDPTKQHSIHQGLEVIGPFKDAQAYAKHHGITHAFIAVSHASGKQIFTWLQTDTTGTAHTQVIAPMHGLPQASLSAHPLDDLLTLELKNNLQSPQAQLSKRFLDLTLSILGLICISPLLLLLYLLIRLDSPGPALYASFRVGKHHKPFYCLKFRTMKTGADTELATLLKANPKLQDEYTTYHKLSHDPRVTRVGAYLRQYHLDELPQLINVLRGSMSLVGARPYLQKELSDIPAEMQNVLFQAQPGMTGAWQTRPHDRSTFTQRLQLESHYIRNWSIWWDLVILGKTVLLFQKIRKRMGKTHPPTTVPVSAEI